MPEIADPPPLKEIVESNDWKTLAPEDRTKVVDGWKSDVIAKAKTFPDWTPEHEVAIHNAGADALQGKPIGSFQSESSTPLADAMGGNTMRTPEDTSLGARQVLSEIAAVPPIDYNEPVTSILGKALNQPLGGTIPTPDMIESSIPGVAITANVASKVGVDLANFIRTPLGIATAEAATFPKIVKSAIAAAFTVHGAMNAQEAVTALANAKTDEEKRNAIAGMLETGGEMAGGLGHLAGREGIGTPQRPEPTIPQQPIEQPTQGEPNAIQVESPTSEVLQPEITGASGNVELPGVEQQNQPVETAPQNEAPVQEITQPVTETAPEPAAVQPGSAAKPLDVLNEGNPHIVDAAKSVVDRITNGELDDAERVLNNYVDAPDLTNDTPEQQKARADVVSILRRNIEERRKAGSQPGSAPSPATIVGAQDLKAPVEETAAPQIAAAEGQPGPTAEPPSTAALETTDALHTAPVADSVNPVVTKELSPQALGISAPMPSFIDKITDVLSGITKLPEMKDVAAAVKGWIGGLAGKTFPKLTELNRTAGELGARWISSRIAARPSAQIFASKVLEGTGVDAAKFGAALHEDNLRSIRKGFEDTGDAEAAAKVNTIIGGKGSPFKTEADYQAFLNDPATKQAVARHIALWDEIIDPMYKKAMSIDPDETLPTRGLQTGARINLNPLREDENMADKVFTVGRGNLLGTMRKKSPFGIQAKGTGTGYGMNYGDVMTNTFGRQLEIANKNAFEDALVKEGLAKVDQPGQTVEVNGREARAYPYKRQTLILEGGQAVGQNRSIYIDPRIASEYEIGANVQKNAFADTSKLLGPTISKINQAALAGFTDATVHISNLASALLTRPSGSGGLVTDTLLSALGRADVPVTAVRAVLKGFKDNSEQIKELSEIGAMRAEHEPSNIPVMRQMSQLIQWADKTTRLTLDDTFKQLVKDGLVEDTETNRREFVNQVGQYNKRAQGPWVRFVRDSGIAPFVTAGKTFNAMGVRMATMSPGVEAASLPAASALRANLAAKWVGAGVLVGTLNYLINGNVSGRKGVPFGAIDTGKTDKNDRPLFIKAFDILGLARALRVTGLRGAIEAKRGGLTQQDQLDSATRDIINSAVAPFTGPAIRFGMALGNKSPAIGVDHPLPIVAPGESQFASNVKNAAIEANPIIASIVDMNKPGTGPLEAAQRQLPRYLPQSGKPEAMMEKYPEIVRKAQARGFVEDVIKHARRMEPEAQADFVNKALDRLKEPEDRKKAEQTLKYSRIKF